jgi:hypothetical protein
MTAPVRGLLIAALWCACSLQAAQVTARILVQNSPLAGFQYYQGKELWGQMKVGDALATKAGSAHCTFSPSIFLLFFAFFASLR